MRRAAAQKKKRKFSTVSTLKTKLTQSASFICLSPLFNAAALVKLLLQQPPKDWEIQPT